MSTTSPYRELVEENNESTSRRPRVIWTGETPNKTSYRIVDNDDSTLTFESSSSTDSLGQKHWFTVKAMTLLYYVCHEDIKEKTRALDDIFGMLVAAIAEKR